MSDRSDEDLATLGHPEMFLEDVEAAFDWRKIPLEGWISIPLFWALAFVVFWQFFTRYALDSSAVWTEEVARQLLILLTFFGAGYALRTRAHICISFFVSRLGLKPRRRLDKLNGLIQLLFYGYSVFLCLKIAKATQFQTLMSVDMSKSVIYYAVAAAFALMTLRAAIDLFLTVRRSLSGTADRSIGDIL